MARGIMVHVYTEEYRSLWKHCIMLTCMCANTFGKRAGITAMAAHPGQNKMNWSLSIRGSACHIAEACGVLSVAHQSCSAFVANIGCDIVVSDH
jgi:hypothetical protein